MVMSNYLNINTTSNDRKSFLVFCIFKRSTLYNIVVASNLLGGVSNNQKISFMLAATLIQAPF